MGVRPPLSSLEEGMALRERPLSPHLQVYRPQLTSMLSIINRATGVFLCLGAIWLVWGVLAVASGEAVYDRFIEISGSTLGVLFLLATLFSLNYHLLNGIRHLLWDTGWGLDIPTTYRTGWIVVILTVLLTALQAWRLLAGIGALT
jgi:succinate dehydrogenase / fumarate reductase, cytochrome b subunit